jgi:GT2 family glycosyltransferase
MQQASNSLIVLVNYKRALDTIDCLRSILSLRCSDWTCVVYENGSADGSFEMISKGIESIVQSSVLTEHQDASGRKVRHFARLDTHPHGSIILIDGKANLGFAGGNNAAYAVTHEMFPGLSFDYYWFLNNDTVVDPMALSELLSRFNQADSKSIGICGSTLVYFEPTDRIQCLGGARYSPFIGRVVEVGNGTQLCPSSGLSVLESTLSYIAGASMFVSRQYIEVVGLMSEDYFLYFEELDWVTRGKSKGFKVAYAPRSIVRHREGAVLGSGKSHTRSVLAEFYGLRSRLRFTIRHYPVAIVTIWLGGLCQLAKRLFDRRWRNASALASALLFKARP